MSYYEKRYLYKHTQPTKLVKKAETLVKKSDREIRPIKRGICPKRYCKKGAVDNIWCCGMPKFFHAL